MNMASEGQQSKPPECPNANMSLEPPPYVVNMAAEHQGNQPTNSGHPAAVINFPASTPVYPVNVPDQSQMPAAGWNAAIYPPPPPYMEAPFQTQTVFMPQIVIKTELRDIPAQTVCPSCNTLCVTQIEYKSGCLTTLLCVLLFFFGCLLGCCLIPCCVNSCKDVNHYCPNCKHFIHKYKRL